MPLHVICSLLTLILLCFPSHSYSTPPCAMGELTIIGKDRGESLQKKNFRYRLNELLQMEVSGDCVKAVENALETNTSKPALQLYLDGILMEGITVSSAGKRPGSTELILTAFLERRSEDTDSKQSWDSYLERQSSGFTMEPTVGLSLNDNIPILVTLPPSQKQLADEKFEFYIAKKESVLWAIGIGFLLFCTVYYLLIKNPTALRDKNSELYSLGKSQMAFWGLLVIISFSCIWFLTKTIEAIPTQILYLMGISGVTGLSSIVINENKKAEGGKKQSRDIKALLDEQKLLNDLKADAPEITFESLNKRLNQIDNALTAQIEPSPTVQSKGFFQDICNGGDGMSFHRLQVVLWTAALGVVFVASITTKISMPEFPENLLFLIGISNLTYIGFKFPDEKEGTA
jgi:hypothetical protein